MTTSWTWAVEDPCPGATRVGDLPAWQHGGFAVSCGSCGRAGLRFAWWDASTGHECGACRRRRLEWAKT